MRSPNELEGVNVVHHFDILLVDGFQEVTLIPFQLPMDVIKGDGVDANKKTPNDQFRDIIVNDVILQNEECYMSWKFRDVFDRLRIRISLLNLIRCSRYYNLSG